MDKLLNKNKYWLALGKNPRIGSATFSEILDKTQDLETIYRACKSELRDLGLSPKTIKEIEFCQKNILPDQVTEDLDKRGISFVTRSDEDYPALLKEIYDPPAILYYKGELEDISPKIAIVGSRKPTDYGISVTRLISDRLAIAGITIVSGMAIGIDTTAHEGAINAGGKTYAILGSGIDYIYPSRNVRLVKDIIENGALISEFPIGVPPQKYTFPLRNRLISGMSRGVVVTEASEKSGSLITAACALEQNREVFAVPGPIHYPNAKGPNNLIKMGAKIITEPEDILEEFGLDTKRAAKEPPKPANEYEAAILQLLASEPRHVDLIIKETKIDQSKISSTLTMMEISGKVKHIGGMVYKINI